VEGGFFPINMKHASMIAKDSARQTMQILKYVLAVSCAMGNASEKIPNIIPSMNTGKHTI